jgi:D-inositol-3-phosphate glycosyltransferase
LDGAEVAKDPVPREQSASRTAEVPRVCLLTGGNDKPYALGMGVALASQHIRVDFIGSERIDGPGLHGNPWINFRNLRGNQNSDANVLTKVLRVLAYYGRLIRYAAGSEARIFHILWNDRFEIFDRTVLMSYYKLLGKKIVLTAHNVNAGKRDADDNWLNRLTLKIQYRLADHIFVHTKKMKSELVAEFKVHSNNVTVIPFGLNDTAPNTNLTAEEARRILGIPGADKTMLFFGNIAPYKGLEWLVSAFADAVKTDGNYRLVIAGSVKGCPEYWREIQDEISRRGVGERILQRIEFIPDEKTEIYFKAADVLVLPYTHVFQSGVLVLAYSFGLPVIASDVGSLREDIVDDETGYIFQPKDSVDLARVIDKYFTSDLYRGLEHRRPQIRESARRRYSWETVGEITRDVYTRLGK